MQVVTNVLWLPNFEILDYFMLKAFMSKLAVSQVM